MKKRKSNARAADTSLRLDWCSYEAAKYACVHWHYSKTIPAGKSVKIGVWERGQYIGAVIFGRGANNNAHKHFKVEVTECCELVRVALREHTTPVTRIVSIALKMLKKKDNGLRLVFSYSDITNQGHQGIIYRAGNWKYLGVRTTNKGAYYVINRKKIHGRSARAKYGSEKNFPIGWRNCPPEKKHLFVYHLRQ